MTMNEKQYAQSSTWNEILSQPATWQIAVTEVQANTVVTDMVNSSASREEWLFVGCGTSFYLAEAAAFSWTALTGQPAHAVPASEVLLYPDLLKAGTGHKQAVVISRSGKTSEAVRAAAVLRQKMQVPTVGITCTNNSELAGECDSSIVVGVADESSTVMTRSFTSMLLSLQVLAACCARKTQFIDSLLAMAQHFSTRLRPLAEQMEDFVSQQAFADYVFLGQGPFHAIAREASLKVMEMSCSYSQFFHALEFRHGPKAIVSPATCLMFLIGQTGKAAEAEVLSEMKALGGITVAICNRANKDILAASDLVIDFEFDGPETALLAPSIVPGQLLGFFTGLRKNLNPDQPKNLTRVVILD